MLFIRSRRRAYSIHISFHSMANYTSRFIIDPLVIITIVNIDSVKISNRPFKLKASYLFPPSRGNKLETQSYFIGKQTKHFYCAGTKRQSNTHLILYECTSVCRMHVQWQTVDECVE